MADDAHAAAPAAGRVDLRDLARAGPARLLRRRATDLHRSRGHASVGIGPLRATAGTLRPPDPRRRDHGQLLRGAGPAGVRLGFSPAAGPRAAPGPRETFNPRYTFEQFVIGEGNRLAHAAALSIAEMPGDTYNPFFLYAPPGLGKTHLLHAIGNYVHAFGAGTRVRYATAEAFTNHFMGALSTRSTRTVQTRLPRRRRSADRRHPVPGREGPHRGGVLSHLQRAEGGRTPDRRQLRPDAARAARTRGPAARAL